jgi:small-conductance mechanosensitive channel
VAWPGDFQVQTGGRFSPHDTAWKIAQTLLGLSLVLICLWLIGYLLSPERASVRGRTAMPGLLRDLIRYGFFLIAFVYILNAVWGEGITPLIGALGVGGIVIGLALQETLSNFFAGLALLAEKPFAPGDWIRIGDRPEGQVEQITWRATKIRTRDNDYQIFPNSLVGKEVIINFRQPNEVHAIRLTIGTSYKDHPDHVKQVIHEVVAGVAGVRREPPPIVYTRTYADFSINYEIKCYIDDYANRPIVEDRIMNRLWYSFRRAGIDIPFPVQVTYEHRMPPSEAPPTPKSEVERAITSMSLFAALTEEERARIIEGSRLIDFGTGEPVIRQGEPGDALYVVLAGAARIAVRTDDGEKTVARLAVGDFFGEMSLLTGEPRTATVYAEGDALFCRVAKDALVPVLQSNPAAAEKIAEAVAHRRQGLDRLRAEAEGEAAAHRARMEGEKKNILGKIKAFFRL